MSYSSQAKPGSHIEPTGMNEANTSIESVRTLASTKYFDGWAGRGEWPVVIANRAVGDLRQLRRRDAHMFKIVGKKIQQGFFSRDNQKRLVGLKAQVPIYEAKTTRDMRIVYQIDIDTDVWTQAPRQIIKIYGLYTHAQMDNRLWSLVSHYHSTRRSKEYRDQCLFRETPRAPANNVTSPTKFFQREESGVPADADLSSDYVMTDQELQASGRSAQLSCKYSEPQTECESIELVNSKVREVCIDVERPPLIDNSDGAHVFQVSPHEKEVIYHDSASFVLGRSGTGKTTCIVFKMLGIERMFEEAGEAKPRQVFITQSPALAHKVQEYYNSLIRTYSSRFVAPDQTISNDEPILADLRDEGVESLGLPSRYSLLEDKHFPLFLSFDQFCSLLEEDYISEFGRSARSQVMKKRITANSIAIYDTDEEFEADHTYIDEQLCSAVRTMERIKKKKHTAITFDVFLRAYWPCLNRGSIHDLDPALVFNEFIGIIEGSEYAANSESGALSRKDYLAVGQKTSLLTSRRDIIYTLYENYCGLRVVLGGYDAAERTHTLLIATQNGQRVPGPKIDALYVDEVQDNLMIDSKLLCNLSDNPHGILMAGDTAQTISAGSSFRFEDLKAFFWRLEDQNKAVRAKKRKAIKPELFHLSVNYRSHSGIVDCASSLVELVSELFPNSIDKLKRETGLIEGPKPVFFSGWEPGSNQVDQFFRDEENVKIDFGANQVILVRNNAAREALRAQVGDIGLILTLFESKGLEFNDVLLYNFFEDSTACAATWHVVLHGRERDKFSSLPQFDAVRYAVICTELKNLYVGLTRARNHCWIWDTSERSEPMKEFWVEQKLVETCRPGDPVPKLSESSSKEEWEAQGRTLFERQLFLQAMVCFQRAGLILEYDISAAYEARKQARLLQATKPNDRESRAALHSAGVKFLECGKLAKNRQQKSCYLRAADCFILAEEWKFAAETFVLVQDFSMAAKSYRTAGCFAEAVEIVQTHREEIQEILVEEIIKVARLEYLRTAQYKQAEGLFDDLDEQLDYMEDCGLESARIEVLEQHQRLKEAAEVAAEAAFGQGDVIGGIRLLQSSNDPKLLRRATKKALGGLWVLYPLSRQVNSVDAAAADTLIRYLKSELGILTMEERHQLDVFQAIRAGDLTRIGKLAQLHAISISDPSYQSIFSLLCFPLNSNSLVPSKEWKLEDIINTAILTLKYTSQLLLFARTLDMSKPSTQMLLGIEHAEHSFKVSSSDSSQNIITSPGFRIYSTSLLFDHLPVQWLEELNQNIPNSYQMFKVSSLTATEYDTQNIALNALYSLLRSEISRVHEATSSDIQAFYPCLDFAVFGDCKRFGCRKQRIYTLKASETERQVFFNMRTRALMMQIQIVDKYQPQTHSDEAERRRLRRMWTNKMYEALMPLFPPIGGFHCLDGARIPELDKGKCIISMWCHQALFELDPRYGANEWFLSQALAYLDLAFRIDGQGFATYVAALHSSRLVKPRPDLMTRFNSDRSLHSIMHDFVAFYRRSSDTAIRGVIQAIRHVVDNNVIIEVNLLVHLLEFIGREIVVQYRTKNSSSGKYEGFDNLLVPQSWALDLAIRPPFIAQRELKSAELMEYLGTLYRILANLREYGQKFPSINSFSKGTLNTLGRGILVLRVCRLIVLVANNTDFNLSMKENARISISRALSGPGEVHSMCDKVTRSRSWFELNGTIMRCPLNRGADRMVRLLPKDSRYPRPPSNDLIRVVTYGAVTELPRVLSFTGVAQKPISTLRPQVKPQVKPFNPLNPSQSSSVSQLNAPNPENSLESAEGGTRDPLMRILTIDEIEAGRRIFHAYRQYVLQKETKQRSAVETIWRCFSRYLHRRDAPRSVTDGQYFDFQRDYTKDIRIPNGSKPAPKSFYRHKAILLGCMPHVAVYLRGLERTNQSQKHANKKRLQTAHHKELEVIQARMDACSEFTIGLKKLGLAIMPGSNELQSLRALRTHVKSIEMLYLGMEEEFGRDMMPAFLKHHHQWGVSIILAQPT